jgi:hypothetical protein
MERACEVLAAASAWAGDEEMTRIATQLAGLLPEGDRAVLEAVARVRGGAMQLAASRSWWHGKHESVRNLVGYLWLTGRDGDVDQVLIAYARHPAAARATGGWIGHRLVRMLGTRERCEQWLARSSAGGAGRPGAAPAAWADWKLDGLYDWALAAVELESRVRAAAGRAR